MADASKVIKGLECCIDKHMCDGYCPYASESKRIEECMEELAKDALAILEEERSEIVTCKDCIYSLDYSDVFQDSTYLCVRYGSNIHGNWMHSFHDGGWFCADGKRREKRNG